MSFTKVAPAGIGTEPGNSILIGDSLLHSTGIDIGSNTGIGVTIRKHGDATFTGIITASAFFGDGSGLEGVSSSGIGTALNDDDTNVLNKIYYVNQELSIGSTVTVNHPDTGTASYTHYQDLVVKNDADFIVADGDTFIPDILGITTSTLAASAATGGRIRAGTITNAGANGAVNFPNGLTGTAGTFTGAITAASGTITGNLGVAGVLTYEDVTNIDSIGVITARSGVHVGPTAGVGATIYTDGGARFSGIVTATALHGDGSNLTGISAGTSLSGSTNNTVCTVTGANAIQGEANFTFDGTDVQVPDKILLNTGGSSIKSNQLRFQSGGAAYIDQYNTSQSINIRVSSSSALDTTAMTINHNGHITRPNTPCASMTIDGSTISGNYMSHNSVHTNIGNHYNTGTSIFTCPVAGLYYVSIMVMSNNNNQTMDLEFHINGSNSTNILVPYQAATGGQYNQVSGSTIVSCPASAQLRFKLNSGDIYSGRHSNMTFALFA